MKVGVYLNFLLVPVGNELRFGLRSVPVLGVCGTRCDIRLQLEFVGSSIAQCSGHQT